MRPDYPIAVSLPRGMSIAGSVLPPGTALARLAGAPHILCHATFAINALSQATPKSKDLARQALSQKHFDVAELLAFVWPARTAVPTPEGLARALGLTCESDSAATLEKVMQQLLSTLASPDLSHVRETAEQVTFLARTNWPWAPYVMKALLQAHPTLNVGTFASGLNVWDRLEEWEDQGPPSRPSHQEVSTEEAHTVLRQALGAGAEARPAQRDYADVARHGFAARASPAFNNILLAEAGTGLGKTLGYLSPAWVYARKNARPVWISTYTKNLQRQLEQETARIVPDPVERREKIVMRKGRENYLCLLNMQEAFGTLQAEGPRGSLLAVLLARWARASRDGDLIGGDFASWIWALFPRGNVVGEPFFPSPQILGLTDRRGECMYVACPHYRRCFIEKNQRSARNASLVIANHALVLHQAAVDHALGLAETAEEQAAPEGLKRIVFDEGHHLFDAADSAFSSHLSAREAMELRSWIRGPETARRRGRGLAERLSELVNKEDGTENLLQQILEAASFLPQAGSLRRIQDGRPDGAAEEFLALVRQQVLARDGKETGFSRETDCHPMIDGLGQAAAQLSSALLRLKRPMLELAKKLSDKLADDAGKLSTAERGRLEALSRALKRRGDLMLSGWLAMLERLLSNPSPLLVDWFSVEFQGAHEVDVGLHSHWLDPTEPLALAVLRPADGVLVTSATLKDRPPDLPDDWQHAEMRTGAAHLPYPVRREHFASPFDYPKSARVIVVTDVGRENMDQLAAAYRELFMASGGGALGLFTAISRLRAVHRRIIEPLATVGLRLLAQHVDPMDTATLVDLFRFEENACLLGTDAVRDGVDVPGRSLRLIVMDRVPWGAPSILERARREAFGKQTYIDMTVRLRLRQAFGRLIRTDQDRGCFVVLDPRLASRFATAFPDGVKIERLGLVEALDAVQGFCNPAYVS